MKRVVDLVEIVRLLQEHDESHLVEIRELHSTFRGTSSVIIGLELVFLNPCSTISENLLFLLFQKNPDLLIFRVATWIFSDA